MEKEPKYECDNQRNAPRINGKGNEASDDCGQMDHIIGGFGKYQFMIFMFKILIGVTSAFNNLGVTFYAPTDFISFWCADTGAVAPTASPNTLAPTTSLSTNVPSIAALNATLGYETKSGASFAEPAIVYHYVQNQTSDFHTQSSVRNLLSEFVSSSERKYKHSLNLNSDTPTNLRQECFQLSPNNQKLRCTSYEYDTGIWISTIVDEWNLVCDRAWFISVTQSLYMAGFIISYLMFGYISDRFGRWNSLLLGALIEISSGFGCALSSSVAQFMIFRFLLGLGNAGRSSSSYLIMIEWTGIKWRMHISTLGSLGWIIGYCMMPWIVLFFLHFRHMQLFVCFYETIFLIWLLRLPESPRWLLTHRRFSKAREVLMMAAKFNGLILGEGQDNAAKNKSIKNSSSTGNLVMEDYSTSSQSSVSSNYGTVTSTFASSPQLANGERRDKLERARALSAIGENQFEETNANIYEIKQRKSSIQTELDESEVKQEKEVQATNGTTSGMGSLCGSCVNWFCGQNQARDIQPYSPAEFDSRFKRLINVIEAKEFTKNEDRLSILDLFRWNQLRKYTLILAYAWALNSFIYYGIALRVGGKNLFLAFTFAGATELPSVAFTMICMKFLPRKTTNTFLFGTIFVLCALQVPLKYYDCQWLQQMTMILAKLFNTCSFTCILYQTMELFPTSIRQTAYSTCSLAGRIGSILAPFIKELSQMTNELVPPIIYAILSLSEIVFIRYLPETQGVDLPDTLLEAEKFKGTGKAKREHALEVAEQGEMNKSK